MADDRPDPLPPSSIGETRAEWEEGPEFTEAEQDAWIAANEDWIRTKIQEALDDPRPSLSMEEVEARAEERYRAMRQKYGR